MRIFDSLLKACANAHRDDSLKHMDRWAMAADARVRLLAEATRDNPYPAEETLFGMKVVIDRDLPEGVIELRGHGGQVVRLDLAAEEDKA